MFHNDDVKFAISVVVIVFLVMVFIWTGTQLTGPVQQPEEKQYPFPAAMVSKTEMRPMSSSLRIYTIKHDGHLFVVVHDPYRGGVAVMNHPGNKPE